MAVTGRLCSLVAGLLLAAGTALAADAGTVRKASELKKEPYRDSRTVGSLAAGDPVDIVRKQGGWFEVRGAKGNGWVRMLSVRRSTARPGGFDAEGILGLTTGRAGTGKVVSTTGIRGLSEAELRAARFDEAQLRRLDSYAVTEREARQFAARGALATRDVQ